MKALRKGQPHFKEWRYPAFEGLPQELRCSMAAMRSALAAAEGHTASFAPLKTIRSLAATSRLCRAARGPVVLVPTMGALHAGHAVLIDRARKLAGRTGMVVVSIFVNPTQFGPKEDFSRYPRTLAADQKLCVAHGADLIFFPTAEAMYPEGFSTYVDEHEVSKYLCGASRPGHFRGVCTVVLKLFQIVQPESAVFGLKDFQQCAVIRRMMRDLNVPVRIVPVETVREPDGLALSSRNRYLTEEERAQAPVLRRALLAAAAAFKDGETSAVRLRSMVVRQIESAPLSRIDYVEIADAETLNAVPKVKRGTVFAVAVFFGKTRLIDNLWLK
jgi:pantoate--beta-alanine ligase